MGKTFKLNNQGQSLVSVLIACAIASTVAMTFAGLLRHMEDQTRYLSEKLAALDFQQYLSTSLTNGSGCAYALKTAGVTFDSTKLPQTITLPTSATAPATLYTTMVPNPASPATLMPGPVGAQVGAPVSPMARSVVVKSIQFQITSGSAGTYAGNWLITFDSSKMVRAIKPVSVAATVSANVSSATAAVITDCQGSASGPAIGQSCQVSFLPSGVQVSITTSSSTATIFQGITTGTSGGGKCCMIGGSSGSGSSGVSCYPLM